MRPNQPLFGAETEARLLSEFRRAAVEVPAYRTLLEEHGVRAGDVHDLASFVRRCPVLSKGNTFDRFRLDEMSVGGTLTDVADVLTSSGHGGRFSFGVTSRKQAAASAEFMDRAFDDAFGITTRKTLTINCLPMGVVFSSNLMTVATTSVREDMAVALVEAFGHHYDQIVLVGDPLFMKRFTDYARERGIDWSRYRINAIIGEEIFGPHFRGYLASSLGLNLNQPADGYIMSSFGVGELGLHLCFETPATIALRRAAFRDAALARDLFGEFAVLPMVLAYNGGRTWIEAVEPDSSGYGRMTISMLDTSLPIPLLRYQTGDVVRLLDSTHIARQLERHGVQLPGPLPDTMLALAGREKEMLADGSHVGTYKDALYSDPAVADRLTGAFRLTQDAGCTVLHVQLAQHARADALFEDRIRRAAGIAAQASSCTGSVRWIQMTDAVPT